MKKTILLIAALVIGATSANAQRFISNDAPKAVNKMVAAKESRSDLNVKKESQNHRKDFVYGDPVMTVDFTTTDVNYTFDNLLGHSAGSSQGQFQRFDTTASSTSILAANYSDWIHWLYNRFGSYIWFTNRLGTKMGDGYAMVAPYEKWIADGGENNPNTLVYNTAIKCTDGFATNGFNTVDVVFKEITQRFNSDRYFIDYSIDPNFNTYDSIEFNVRGVEMGSNEYAPYEKRVTLPVASSVNKDVLYIRLRYMCPQMTGSSLAQPSGYFWFVDEINVYNGPEYRVDVLSTNHYYSAYGVVPSEMALDSVYFWTTIQNTGGKTLFNAVAEELTHNATNYEFPNVFGSVISSVVNHSITPQNITTATRVDTTRNSSGSITGIDIRRHLNMETGGARLYNGQAGLYGLSQGVKYLQSVDSTNYQVLPMQDSLYYRVSQMPVSTDPVGKARWASDVDVLIEGSAWAYGFNQGFIAENAPGARVAGYEVCNRFMTPSDLDTANNAIYAKGVEIVPAADSCDAGLRIQVSLKYYDFTPGTAADALIVPANAQSAVTVVNEGLNNGVFTNPDAREWSTNYNSVYLPFVEENVKLYPGQFYYACYKLLEDGRFYVARDDKDYLPTFKTYDWWGKIVMTPGQESEGYAWGYPFGDWYSEYNAPMIRLMVSKNPLSINGVTPATPSFNLNAYPNPAQNATTIEYALTSNANVYITVTDIMGREVVRLNEGNKAANTVNRVSLDTKNLNNGTYFYTINVNGVKETKKLVINK
ncbi:MAG: hypothetical protein H6Q16_719 [Bacteroidetes bacterium]|nr:hypothetical protein [Bacteroidota bacterium]